MKRRNELVRWLVTITLGLPLAWSPLGLGGTGSQKAGRIVVHGHRGTRGTRPENTLPAFREAVAVGVDFLELDLHLTKDDVLVISHDPVLTGEKCRDAEGELVKAPIRIRELTFAELRQYDCGSVRLPLFPEQVLVPHTPRPSFEELVDWVSEAAPRVGLNIETKMDEARPELNPDPKHFVEKIVAVLNKHHRVEKDLLQSFDFSTLKAAAQIEPKLKRVCLFESAPATRHFCRLTVEAGGAVASPEAVMVDASEMKECRERGIPVVPWTVNDSAGWDRMIGLGVSGIITDYPKKLMESLSRPSPK